MGRKEIVLKSRKIAEYIYSTEDFKKSKVFALYSPIKNEVETEMIFQQAKMAGKLILYPRIDKNSLLFSVVNDLRELVSGKFGLLEPPSTARTLPSEEIDAFIVPGVAFDTRGYRLGYGYGYYDSTLRNVRGVVIGLAYRFQVVNSIFPDDKDIRVQKIITEEGIINCIN